MSVSFTTLFERSKYCGGRKLLMADKAERERIMEQHERFAVGMVGFVLDHDPAFRSHFLTKICKLGSLAGSSGWEVLAEPAYWGDLVLKHKDQSWLVVVEFKIEADLKEHQNPTKVAFNDQKPVKGPAGYGAGIVQFAHDQGLRNVEYVTVQKEASWKTRDRCAEVTCIPSEWKRLMRDDVAGESGLEACLYDSLGRLGLYTFWARKMNGMKLADHATAPLDLLICVLAGRGIEFDQKEVEVGQGSFGIKLTSKDFRLTAAVVKPEDSKTVGWFGYESGASGPGLSVWLYSTAATADEVKKRLEMARKQAGGRGKVEVNPDDRCVNIFLPASLSQGDKEWFTKVLEVAAPES